METPNPSYKFYKFNFWKDRFWMWALSLPFGLICWAIPFVLFIGLSKADNAPGWFPLFGFLFLGIPSYLVGWIFVYSLMEGLYTKVTFADDWVSIRLPWLIFPIIPIVKRIDLERIRRINLFAAYGSRTAVFLYYFEKNKERHFYLPRFKNNPPYLQMMMALNDRIEPPLIPSISSPDSEPQGTPFPNEALIKAKRYPHNGTRFIDKVFYPLIAFSILAMAGTSGWITLSLPTSSKTDAFAAGFSLSIVCFWLAFCGFLPGGIGLVAFWFLGHPIIRAILWLVQVPDVNWETPPVVNQLLGRWNISPIHSTLVEFLFWATLVISIEFLISSIAAWLRRRAYK
ncbi:MAG: hypothetical protein NTW99_08450 [Chloroflexi bacterium]|nr:hypothetical protein [Chloroflexota bacterium]